MVDRYDCWGKHEDGRYVSHEDYEKLQAENKALKEDLINATKSIEILTPFKDRCDDLKDECIKAITSCEELPGPSIRLLEAIGSIISVFEQPNKWDVLVSDGQK